MTNSLQLLSGFGGLPQSIGLQGLGATDYTTRPEYAEGRAAMDYLFKAMEEIAPLRPSLLKTPFDNAAEFIAYVNSKTPHTIWSLGDDITMLKRDGRINQDELHDALLESANELSKTGGVWDSLKSPQVVYRKLQAEAVSWKLRDVWGGTKEAAGAVAEAVPTSLVEVGETAKTVASGMQTVAKIAPYALGVLGLFIVYRYAMVGRRLIPKGKVA